MSEKHSLFAADAQEGCEAACLAAPAIQPPNQAQKALAEAYIARFTPSALQYLQARKAGRVGLIFGIASELGSLFYCAPEAAERGLAELQAVASRLAISQPAATRAIICGFRRGRKKPWLPSPEELARGARFRRPGAYSFREALQGGQKEKGGAQ